jgi:hypothetical protein
MIQMPNLIRCIETINKISNISIEYAVMEQTLSTNFERIEKTLHLVYTPTMSSILTKYVSGSSIEAIYETVYTNTEVFSFFMSRVSEENKYLLQEFSDCFSDISKIIVSTMARFCNFNLVNSMDPFFSMFLEESNIIWKSRDFDTFFFSIKSNFLPSKYILAISILDSLEAVGREIVEVTGRYSYKEKIKVIYPKLPSLVKLYFITLNYLKTNELSSFLSEDSNLILATLEQADKPLDFIAFCCDSLRKELGKLSHESKNSMVSLLKNQAINFLQYKLCEEIKSIYIPQ